MTRNIRATRDRLGLTTAGLARLVGVTSRTAQRWIEGSRAVPEPVWRLLTIADAADWGYDLVEWAGLSNSAVRP